MRALLLILALALPGSCLRPAEAPPEAPVAAAVATEAEPATGEAAAAAPPVADAPAPVAEPAPAEQTPEQPPEGKSPQQIACEKRGGQFAALSNGSALRTCLIRTRDFAKQCASGADCEGVCLARSRTCSPVVPLMGCNEVLLEGGSTAVDCVQ